MDTFKVTKRRRSTAEPCHIGTQSRSRVQPPPLPPQRWVLAANGAAGQCHPLPSSGPHPRPPEGSSLGAETRERFVFISPLPASERLQRATAAGRAVTRKIDRMGAECPGLGEELTRPLRVPGSLHGRANADHTCVLPVSVCSSCLFSSEVSAQDGIWASVARLTACGFCPYGGPRTDKMTFCFSPDDLFQVDFSDQPEPRRVRRNVSSPTGLTDRFERALDRWRRST